MREQTDCFTGHRAIPSEQESDLWERLRETLIKLIGNGYRFFGADGAVGFDTMAAKAVLDLRKEYPQVRLILVLPCLSQADRWNARDKAVYEDIKTRANKVVYTSVEYTRDCMFKRNRHLVEGSSVCVCYLMKNTGGTAYTVEYARKKGLTVINLA